MKMEIYLKRIKIRKGQYRIEFNCKYCACLTTERESHYIKKKRHYCSIKCYSMDRKSWDFTLQPAYKGIRKRGETKQIYHKRYCKNKPNKIKQLKVNKYAREKGAIGYFSEFDWMKLKAAYNYKCAFCKKRKPLTRDHIKPLSKGGNNKITNIQPLCKSCNSKKWRYENPALIEEFDNDR